jgi:hypothetical protein
MSSGRGAGFMKMLPYRLLLACCIGLSPWTVAAQEPLRVPVPFDGTEAFGHILHSFDLKPVAQIDNAFLLVPEKTLLVVFGELGDFEKWKTSLGNLKTYRDEGGAILLASDYPARMELPPGNLVIGGTKVKATGASKYKEELPECPVVKLWTDRLHPLFKDLHKGLATNCPSFVRANGLDLLRLADFSEDCVQIRQGAQNLPPGVAYIVGSPKDARAAGRTVVLAGQGIFLNGMLIQTDNDNFSFAWNTIEWLTQGPSGRREHCLFIDNGNVVDNFALPLSKFGGMPVPPIQVINRVIRGLEDENVFNHLLLESFRKEHYLRGLLLLGSLAVLVWGAWRIMHGRFHLDSGVPLVIGKLQTAAPAAPVLEQRRDELRRQGNLWEPAQVLARQFFLDYAGLTVPLWDEEAAPPVALEAHGNFWQRRKLTRQVQRIWNLARSSPAQPVPPPQFDELLRLMADVSGALTAGRARFVR